MFVFDRRSLAAACLAAVLSQPLRAEPAEVGRALFLENCEPCHGATATEGGAGDIRGMDFTSVRRATRGIEQMPTFDLDDDQIEAIVAYLAELSGR